ncbi:hypothetical protein C3B59_08270 [Cryobacterium zongtaii]|uniref:Uncharacterized protein n=1 Tax=Cryobacterium zongtaii TaxID=1259217 RepID=A0A2S3ZG98_9MICO|nr:hypothetical protein [Cryobacterium zongtaii]POH66410.1 hypothetical protein C3B59_08270 [Cryobacterium zongtaii]
MLEVLGAARPGVLMFRHTGVFDRARLTVSYVLDPAEHESRLANGMGAETDEYLLAGLLTLPVDDIAPVDARFVKLLSTRKASRAVTIVNDPDGGAWGRRLLGSPVEVIEIEAESMDAAHRWTGYGPRLARTAGGIETFELTKAAHYGIGIVTPDGQRLLEPSTSRPLRWTSARWRFAELVYAQFRELGG